jgi:hypothetical protein
MWPQSLICFASLPRQTAGRSRIGISDYAADARQSSKTFHMTIYVCPRVNIDMEAGIA